MDVQLLFKKQTWGPSGGAEFLTGHPLREAICKQYYRAKCQRLHLFRDGWFDASTWFHQECGKWLVWRENTKLTENKNAGIWALLYFLAVLCPKGYAAQSIFWAHLLVLIRNMFFLRLLVLSQIGVEDNWNLTVS